MQEYEDSHVIAREPCPSCGSRDNLARYSDGHAYCFSPGCNHREPADDEKAQKKNKRRSTAMDQEDLPLVRPRELKKRRLTEETCRLFGYGIVEYQGDKYQAAELRAEDGHSIAGLKLRTPDKDFPQIGDKAKRKKAMLFGQHLWGDKGKKLIITEGEIDAMSVSQVQGHKWPVVSIINGAQSAHKDVARWIEWCNGFDEIILMFDMDEAGRLAAQECIPLFKPGKVKIAHMDAKDANDLLVEGRADEITKAIWNAKTYRPDGLITLDDIQDQITKPVVRGLDWFCPQLTELTYGRRPGVYAFGAGTGIGKTDFLTQQVQYDISVLRMPVALFFLEQPPVETARRIAGKFAGRRFHVPDAGWTNDELTQTIADIQRGGRLHMYDSFGATDWSTIANTIRFLATSEGVKLFYLDHLTALAAFEDDERKALESIMAEIAMLAQELDIIIHLVSHLATPEGTPHEEGGRVMIRHFKGSRAIGFWCHYMFGMERFQQHTDETIRQTTFFRILKDRYTGQATGHVIGFGYDVDKGLLLELPKAETEERLSKTKAKKQNARDFGFTQQADDDEDCPF